MMEYQGYLGQVEYDDEAKIFHGEVVNTRDVITFQGQSVQELEKAFKDSVEDYLKFCQERGEPPDQPFSGQFLARVSPALHRRISEAAARSKKKLSVWVAEQLRLAVDALDSRRSASGKARSGKKQPNRARPSP